MATFVNLTPHDVIFEAPDGSRRVFPKSAQGRDARVDTLPVAPEAVGVIDGMALAPYPEYGPVVGLPNPIDGTIFIVSLIVLGHPEVAGRTDLIAPGTGPHDGAIRFSEGPRKGQIEAVTRWVATPKKGGYDPMKPAPRLRDGIKERVLEEMVSCAVSDLTAYVLVREKEHIEWETGLRDPVSGGLWPEMAYHQIAEAVQTAKAEVRINRLSQKDRDRLFDEAYIQE